LIKFENLSKFVRKSFKIVQKGNIKEKEKKEKE
jgi:hypothetical protein